MFAAYILWQHRHNSFGQLVAGAHLNLVTSFALNISASEDFVPTASSFYSLYTLFSSVPALAVLFLPALFVVLLAVKWSQCLEWPRMMSF